MNVDEHVFAAVCDLAEGPHIIQHSQYMYTLRIGTLIGKSADISWL